MPESDRIYGTGDDVVTDSETGLAFTRVPAPRWESSLVPISAGTAPDSNGTLEARDGQYVRVIYNDRRRPTRERRSAARPFNCRVQFEFGAAKFSMFGHNASAAVNGGCERDARGYFVPTFGYPDQYMDHGELIDFQMAIRQLDTIDLENATATLKAVLHDTDSPQSCQPHSRDCADPNRTNNPVVDQSILRVLDSPKNFGFVPSLFGPSRTRLLAGACHQLHDPDGELHRLV